VQQPPAPGNRPCRRPGSREPGEPWEPGEPGVGGAESRKMGAGGAGRAAGAGRWEPMDRCMMGSDGSLYSKEVKDRR
ncbi:hypothetical protein FQN60_008078, partial [Etheostoma spectabile]